MTMKPGRDQAERALVGAEVLSDGLLGVGLDDAGVDATAT